MKNLKEIVSRLSWGKIRMKELIEKANHLEKFAVKLRQDAGVCS